MTSQWLTKRYGIPSVAHNLVEPLGPLCAVRKDVQYLTRPDQPSWRRT